MDPTTNLYWARMPRKKRLTPRGLNGNPTTQHRKAKKAEGPDGWACHQETEKTPMGQKWKALHQVGENAKVLPQLRKSSRLRLKRPASKPTAIEKALDPSRMGSIFKILGPCWSPLMDVSQ